MKEKALSKSLIKRFLIILFSLFISFTIAIVFFLSGLLVTLNSSVTSYPEGGLPTVLLFSLLSFPIFWILSFIITFVLSKRKFDAFLTLIISLVLIGTWVKATKTPPDLKQLSIDKKAETAQIEIIDFKAIKKSAEDLRA